MRKSKLYKLISVFQIIIFSLLFLVGLACLAMALFEKFNVEQVLKFVNEKAHFLKEGYLYILNFFDTIYFSLEINKLSFIEKIIPYLDIIYTGIFVFIALLGLIFGLVGSRAASGKHEGKGAAIFAFIINFIIAGAFTAFAVYFFLNIEAVEKIVTPEANSIFKAEHFAYDPLINKIIIYAVAGTTLFIMLFNFIGICIGGSKEKYKEPKQRKNKEHKQDKKNMGSYNPKMKPKDFEEDSFLSNKTADYMRYQDSKSGNPYINGNAELKEDDLFSDLKPKNPITPSKPNPIKDEDDFLSALSKPEPNTPSNPFTSNSNILKPTQNSTGNNMMQNSNNNLFAQPQYNTNNFANPQPAMGGFNNGSQFNNFARPATPYNQNMQMQNPQAAPTNINLTISPVAPTQANNMQSAGQNYSQPAPQQFAQTSAYPQTAAPKSADEAFSAKPKAPTQALAKPKQTEQSLTDKLKELSTLRQTGAISDDEYKALKQKAFQKFLKS